MAAEVGQAKLQVTRKPRVAIHLHGRRARRAWRTRRAVSDSQQQQHFARRAGDACRRRTDCLRQISGRGRATPHRRFKRLSIHRTYSSSAAASPSANTISSSRCCAISAPRFFSTRSRFARASPPFSACAGGKPVFGLPGNPVSTMVTFELFVAPAIEILSGSRSRARYRFSKRG